MKYIKNCLKQLSCISIVGIAVFANGKDMGIFTVDPGVAGTLPSVSIATAPNEKWHAFFYQLNGGSTDFFTSSTNIATSESLIFKFPEVEKNTFAEIALTTRSAPRSSDFRWRTLLRPKGKALMDYRGQKELLPPDDFDKYWKRAKKQLDEVSPNPRVTRVTDKDTSTGLLFRVELDSVENTTIVGWFFVPRDAYQDGDPAKEVIKQFPAIIITPGYGAEEPPIDRTKAGYITFSTNPRNHGPSKVFWKSPVEHRLYNIMKPEDYYYKLASLDCLQAARFVLGRKEVQEDRVGTEGGSQGGYFAVATAMLEPRICCVAANVIAFTDYPDGSALATRGHHTHVRELLNQKGTTATIVGRSLSYTDGVNLITRVKAPVQILMGAVDPVCPYICGIVAYNRMPDGVEKDFHVYPSAAHEVTSEMREANRDWYDRWLKSSEKKKQD